MTETKYETKYKVSEDRLRDLIDTALSDSFYCDWISRVEGDTFHINEAVNGEKVFSLDLQKGLNLFSKEGRHFEDFLKEDEDVVTGLVFLQLCLFGDVIFG